MRIIYKGKFKEGLNDYIQEQPWMFELDAVGLSFWELPVSMQWGVVQDFADKKGFIIDSWRDNISYDYSVLEIQTEYFVSGGKPTLSQSRVKAIQELQKWYNENN